MLNFYVSCRPIRIGKELVTPRDQFANGFEGLDIQGNCIAMNMSKDGRMLYEVIVGSNSSYTDQQCLDYQAIILEGLSCYGVHLKTVASAQALAELITEDTYTISEDGKSLIPPASRNS